MTVICDSTVKTTWLLALDESPGDVKMKAYDNSNVTVIWRRYCGDIMIDFCDEIPSDITTMPPNDFSQSYSHSDFTVESPKWRSLGIYHEAIVTLTSQWSYQMTIILEKLLDEQKIYFISP